jgi:hypothetical protein
MKLLFAIISFKICRQNRLKHFESPSTKHFFRRVYKLMFKFELKRQKIVNARIII